MEDDDRGMSFFDVADWAWSFRWLMLALTIIAIGWATISWNIQEPEVPSYELSLQIFSGGTPIRDAAGISDILANALRDPELTITSRPSSNPVTFRSNDSQAISVAEAKAENLADALIDEVSAQESELRRLLPQVEAALVQYLASKAFVEGARSGLVPLIVATTMPVNTIKSPRLGLILKPTVICIFLFFLIAGFVSFVRAWRLHIHSRPK